MLLLKHDNPGRGWYWKVDESDIEEEDVMTEEDETDEVVVVSQETQVLSKIVAESSRYVQSVYRNILV